MKKHEKKIGKRKSRQEILKNREKKKENIGQTRNNDDRRRKTHEKKQITGGFGKTFSSFQKIDHRKY